MKMQIKGLLKQFSTNPVKQDFENMGF